MIPMLGQCFRQLAIIHVQHAVRQSYAFINPALAYDANFDPAAAARSIPRINGSLKIFIFGQLILGLGTVACLYVLLLRLPVSLLLCLPLPGLLHKPVVLLYNAFSPVRLMLQHGPGFRVLSRDLFRQCLHLGHKPVDERHHLVHGLLEGIFIFRVFIGTGNKRPQRLRRGNGVIQRVRRQFLQGFLPAQLLAFGGLVLLLLLRHSGLQVVSFRISQQLQYHILQVLGLLPHLLPDVVPPFVGRHPRQIPFLRVQCHHHALGGRVYTVGAPVPNAVHHRVMHPVGLGIIVQQR